MTDRAEALREVVLESLPIDPDDGTTVVGFGKEGVPLWSKPDQLADAIVAAILPVLDDTERQIRAKVLNELETHFRSLEWPKQLWKADIRRIVRGTSA